MSNGCVNYLYVTNVGSNHEALNEFIEAVRDPDNKEDFSPGKIYPCPDEINHSLMPGSDWYRENWGTKWCGDGQLAMLDYRRILYTFISASNPPVNWLRNVAQKFSDLYFVLKYEEFDNDVVGVCQVHNDKFFDQGISFN